MGDAVEQSSSLMVSDIISNSRGWDLQPIETLLSGFLFPSFLTMVKAISLFDNDVVLLASVGCCFQHGFMEPLEVPAWKDVQGRIHHPYQRAVLCLEFYPRYCSGTPHVGFPRPPWAKVGSRATPIGSLLYSEYGLGLAHNNRCGVYRWPSEGR
ncbi:hypothetical protein PVK06_041770 [Gossypium arboreum]|uniref:Uncharacterized protein n=1 Tax=Gossypium arboreum TaxID=29729 RepID=A0ABR0N959_GOSAR|nr:hypothetical protein PVK06_041770 [Gossypium arboreum]